MRISLKRSFLGLIGLALLLGACSPAAATATAPALTPTSGQTPAITPTATPTEAGNLPTLDLPDDIQVALWHPWTGEMAGWLETAAADFNRDNPWSIEVSLHTHADDLVLFEDILRASTDGDLPDMVIAPSTYLASWSQSGLPLRNLDEYIDSGEVGWSADQVNSFLPLFWKTDMDGSYRLGLPAYRVGYFIFYNRTWARELGFESDPQTSLEFSEQACAAANANLRDSSAQNNGTGGLVYSTQPFFTLSWLKSFAGDKLVAEDGTLDFTAEGSQAALEYLFDLYNQDCAWTGRQTTPYQYFSERYALFFSGDSRDILIQERANQASDVEDDWALLPFPSDQNRPVLWIDGDSYAILGEENDQTLAAWLFLRYLLEPRNQIAFIENTGVLPLSNEIISAAAEFRALHPVWDQALQYLALAQAVPNDPGWMQAEAAASDLAWQLKFLASRESIPGLLTEAQSILQERDQP